MSKTVGCGCDRCMNRGVRRNFRHGIAGDGWEDTPYRKPAKKKKRPARRGCPENNGKSHVYIWLSYDSVWLPGYEIKACAGCGKRAQGRKSFRRKL